MFKKSRRLPSGVFLLRFKNNKLEHARLGMIVGKKAVGRATARNRLKRLIRASFSQHAAKLGAMDCVVQVRKGADKHNNEEIFRMLESLWVQVEGRA